MLSSPSLDAVSGVSTHVNMLLSSPLAQNFDLLHFRVGSEGQRQKESFVRMAWRLVSSPLGLALVLYRHRPAVLHLNTSLNQKAYWRDLVYLVVARLMRCDVISQIHGGAMPQTFFPHSRFFTWILRRSLVASCSVVVLSKAEAEAYRTFDRRINVQLVPNAIDSSSLSAAARSFNHDAPLRLVYVGRLISSKGLFEAVESLRLFKAEGRKFTFRVAGSGPDDLRLRAAVAKAGLERETAFLGPVFGEAKSRLWLESDIFVFPTYHEGLPYAILEAMAAGCVPVTCAVGAIPDVLQEGTHGLFVPPHDTEKLARALVRLDTDREGLACMAHAARERVQTYYTSERLTRDFQRLYER